jgi:hypothetical protein
MALRYAQIERSLIDRHRLIIREEGQKSVSQGGMALAINAS